MKKALILAMIFLVSISLVVAQSQGSRHFIKSHKGLLKVTLGVQHVFAQGFTTDLTPGQVTALKKLGWEVEPVQLYQVLGKPVCGDNVCQGNEPKTCPADCPAQPPEERSCYPTQQLPYGIIMVNGGTGGAGVTVAVLDTGVYKGHADLTVQRCKDTTKRGIRNGCSDQQGHGTHVSGTIAANGGADGLGIFGVAPDANLWMIKVCGNSGCWADDIAEAIRYSADNGAEIISMSLGGDSPSVLIGDAVSYAASKGLLIVAAAGNDGPADGTIDYPGAFPEVVAVGALDSGKGVASFSSRGINDGDGIIEVRELELAAAGVSVLSTTSDGCYATASGTSMATPHVAGLAAKLWQGNGAATRAYLHSIAQDVHTAGEDTATGFGLPVAP